MRMRRVVHQGADLGPFFVRKLVHGLLNPAAVLCANKLDRVGTRRCEGSRLVKDDGIDLGHAFEDEGVFEKDLDPSQKALSRAQSERSGQSQSAGTSDDEDRNEGP